MTPITRLSTLAVGAVALTLAVAGCTDNATPAGAGTLNVTITDTTCQVSAAQAPSGTVNFEVKNTGTVANEFEILAADKLRIVVEKENIGPGTTVQVTTAMAEGTYYTACKPNMVGDLVGVTEFKVTPGAQVQVSDDVKQLQDKAVDSYTDYIKDQAGALLTNTQKFAQAYAAGDTETAKRLYPLARMYFERIEPTAEAFGISEPGDLDAALDRRIQDVALEANAQVTDPAVLAQWHGWHRMEADLFSAAGSAYKITDPAARQAEADQLVTNTQTLYDLVSGKRTGADGKPFAVTLADINHGAGALMEEVAKGKIVGEEETFSHTDLYDFQANLEGAQVAYGNVQDIVKKKDPSLDTEITQRFATIAALLQKQQTGTAADGSPTYPDYSTIAAVQKEAGEVPNEAAYTPVQREFSDGVNAVSESLSKVAAVVLN
ncbi:iron uptake system protein EfeO [Granulicoccus phenolivorans]|uniref:iron uptake system protein EfeO n=1 Tax=Granulicoccus phenolivorans TaxID=266854 RepID=UPI00042A1BD0|nr:iron uptake system protein EfeO [Granulicoccus phenolivorans]